VLDQYVAAPAIENVAGWMVHTENASLRHDLQEGCSLLHCAGPLLSGRIDVVETLMT
jgi:hypothetical protein